MIRRGLVVLTLCLLASSAFAAKRVVLSLPAPQGQAARSVELFVETPAGPGRHPAILLVHGHQIPTRPGAKTLGGKVYVEVGRLERLARRGYVAAAISQPGYGGSDGPRDFCGPDTQAAIRLALTHLRDLPGVDPARVALYGVSRGAIAGAMVATQVPWLSAVVLVAGIYDLQAAVPSAYPRMDDNIAAEAGLSIDAFVERSALYHLSRYKARTLILHGRDDDRAPLRQALALAASLRQREVPVELKLFDEGHRIPAREQWEAIYPFLGWDR